jgi:metal-responsive CopG/Arc/MetJ family transcriptional regulator
MPLAGIGVDVPAATRYNLVILALVKTAISLPDTTFQRVDHAAKRLGVSRSEFFAWAAERWLDTLDDDGTTEAIDRAIAGLAVDHTFTDAAAASLTAADQT